MNFYPLLKPVDNYFLNKQEPIKSCLQSLRALLLEKECGLTESWKYGMPFYLYQNKMFCYLWVHKKFNQPYLGIVNGNLISDPDLLQEKRSRMKILLIDPEKDIPVKRIKGLIVILKKEGTRHKEQGTRNTKT